MRADGLSTADTPSYEHAPSGANTRSRPLKDLTSYPSWIQDMVQSCAEARTKLLNHEFWRLMKAAQLDFEATRNFLVGAWPVVDQFPHYMALNLLKARYGRGVGEDMARRWLIRNIRVEQNHARYWLDWAIASGVSHADIVDGIAPPGTVALSNWLFQTCEREDLATAMAAANYAIEGVTGDWACYVTSTPDYENSFDERVRRKAMRWLRSHAEYDDVHPWEALEIVSTLAGAGLSAHSVSHVGNCVRKTYDIYRLSLDYCFER